MNSHYCDIFGDCWHCPAPVCPHEKYEDNFRGSDADKDMEGDDPDKEDSD